MSLPRPCCCCHRGRVHSVQFAPLPIRQHPRSPPRNSPDVDEIRSPRPAPLAIEQDETHISYPRSPYPLSQTQMGAVHIGETVYKELLAVCTNIESLEDSIQSEPTISCVHSHTADLCEASSHSALRVRCRKHTTGDYGGQHLTTPSVNSPPPDVFAFQSLSEALLAGEIVPLSVCEYRKD